MTIYRQLTQYQPRCFLSPFVRLFDVASKSKNVDYVSYRVFLITDNACMKQIENMHDFHRIIGLSDIIQSDAWSGCKEFPTFAAGFLGGEVRNG